MNVKINDKGDLFLAIYTTITFIPMIIMSLGLLFPLVMVPTILWLQALRIEE